MFENKRFYDNYFKIFIIGGMVPFPPQQRQKYGFTDDAVIVDSLMDAEPRYFQGTKFVKS